MKHFIIETIKNLAIATVVVSTLIFLTVFAAAEGDFAKTVEFGRWAIGV